MALVDAYNQQTQQQGGLYSSAIKKFSQRFGQVNAAFGEGLGALKEAATNYGKGGAFSTSQFGQIEQGTQQAIGQGTSNLISSGMWSGTNTSGLIQSAMQQQGLQKAGVEAERVGNLSNLQAAIAQLKSGQAQTIASMQEPDYSQYYNQGFGPFMSATASQYGNQLSALASIYSANKQASVEREKIAASKKK